MIKSILTIASAIFLMSSSALAQEQESDDAPSCVNLRNINGYSVIDNQHLLLQGGVSKHYLITTQTRCSGLRFGAQIGTSFDENARLCRPFVEYIVPDDGWRCAIDTIEEVEDEDAARALIAERAEAENESN